MMIGVRLLHFVMLLGVIASFQTGCAAIDYDQVNVRVIDGDTGQPVPFATVDAPHGSWGAQGQTVQADAAGVASVRVARNIGAGVRAAANGYLWSVDYRKGESGTDAVVARIYRTPEPLAGVTVPNDFRGAFRVRERTEVAVQPDEPPPLHGQREFYTPIEPNGITTLQPPPAVFGGQPYAAETFCARRSDGTLLRFENPTARTGSGGESVFALPDIRDRVPPAADGVALFDLGLMFVDAREYGRVFFIGTAADAATAQREWSDRAGTMAATRPTNGFTSPPFRASPLSLDGLTFGTQLTPRPSDANSPFHAKPTSRPAATTQAS